MYHRCPKCRQISSGKKCQYCKIKVANANKTWHTNRVNNFKQPERPYETITSYDYNDPNDGYFK